MSTMLRAESNNKQVSANIRIQKSYWISSDRWDIYQFLKHDQPTSKTSDRCGVADRQTNRQTGGQTDG